MYNVPCGKQWSMGTMTGWMRGWVCGGEGGEGD